MQHTSSQIWYVANAAKTIWNAANLAKQSLRDAKAAIGLAMLKMQQWDIGC